MLRRYIRMNAMPQIHHMTTAGAEVAQNGFHLLADARR